MDPLGMGTGITIGLILALVGAIGSPVVVYVRTMTRIETEGKAFRDRFNEHAIKLEQEIAGVNMELRGLRTELSRTILDTARQSVKVENLERATEGFDRRLFELERLPGGWGSERSGTRGGNPPETD